MSPSRTRASVDFPLPDSPTTPSVSPARSSIDTSVRTRTASVPRPKVLEIERPVSTGPGARSSPGTGASRSGSACSDALRVEAAVQVPGLARERRVLARAPRLGDRAAIGEHAPDGRAAHLGQPAGDRGQRTLVLARTQPREAAEQAGRVGMARVREHRAGRSLLDEPPRVEDADALADPRDDVEVVRDEQDGRAELGAQRRDQIEHLGLDRRVEPGRRLVEDQQLRVLRERHRDHDALLHPARQLVRVAPHDDLEVGDLDPAQHLERLLARRFPRRAADLERLGDLRADPHRGVQRACRRLVDHRHGVAAQAPERLAAGREQIVTGELRPRPPSTRPFVGR